MVSYRLVAATCCELVCAGMAVAFAWWAEQGTVRYCAILMGIAAVWRILLGPHGAGASFWIRSVACAFSTGLAFPIAYDSGTALFMACSAMLFGSVALLLSEPPYRR